MLYADNKQVIDKVNSQKLSAKDLNDIKTMHTQLKERSLSEVTEPYGELVEKTIRFVQVNRAHLKRTLFERFQDHDIRHLLLDILISKAWPKSNINEFNSRRPDLRALNAALWLERVVSSDGRLQQIIRELPEQMARRKESWSPIKRNPSTLKEQQKLFNKKKGDKSAVDSVVVLCPNLKSPNTLCTLKMLGLLDIKVSHILVRPLFSLSRLREELQFSPSFLLKRVKNELFHFRKERKSPDHADLSSLKLNIDCEWKNVVDAGSEIGAEVFYFDNFNSASCLSRLASIRPKFGVFTGGGILSKEFLQQFTNGVIHAHPGILPEYRGMDVVQWAILEGNYSHVGSTCQLMSPKLDAGTLLSNFTIDITTFNSLQAIRTAVVAKKISLVCETLRQILNHDFISPVQPETDGKIYYLLHPKLNTICSDFIETGQHLVNADQLLSH